MRRLLFVTYLFPPSAGGGIPRILSFTRELPRYGWLPTILTSPSAGKAAVDGSTLASLSPEIQIARAYCPIAARGLRGHVRAEQGVSGNARRFAKFASKVAMVPEPFAPWIPFALARGRELLSATPHDAVLATYGPPANLLVGAALARMYGLPLVLDFRDLWSDLPFAKFPSVAHHAIVRQIERAVIRQARAVTTVSDAMSAHLCAQFSLPAERVETVVNGFEDDTLALVIDGRREIDRPFRICYSGSAYEGYDLSPFLRAVKQLADQGTITPSTFRFLTLGSFAHDVAERHGVGAFHDFEPFIPKAQMFARFAEVDAFLLVEMGAYGAKMGYPVKMFDYLLTGKPILGIGVEGSNGHALLREIGPQHQLVANEVEAIARSLTGMLAARNAPPGPVDVDRAPLARFSRRRNVATLASVLDRAVREPPRASSSRT
ncbi:MAG: glycosyltransferase [Myxococcales bacterium]|nr:glycosyltransferase [Myxococcales bacterium]